MFKGKPIVLSGNGVMGEVLSGLLPQDPQPEFRLPLVIEQKRDWGVWFELLLVATAVALFGAIGVGAIVSLLKLPTVCFPIGLGLIFIAFDVYVWTQRDKITTAMKHQCMTLTTDQTLWETRGLRGGPQRRQVPLRDYEGIRHHCQEIVTYRGESRYHREIHSVVLQHREPDLCVQLYAGETTRYIDDTCRQWSQLLDLPILEPNDLAKERMAATSQPSLARVIPIDSLEFNELQSVFSDHTSTR